MKRSIISLISILTFCGVALVAASAMADDDDRRRLSATVSFGQWEPNDPDLLSPLNRLLGDPAMGVGNNHELIPDLVKITEGGSVNFIIGGQHIVAIYDNGHKPGDIDTTLLEVDNPATTTVNEACATNAGGVLRDSNRRIYRGPCHVSTAIPAVASVTRRDGVEVVKFSKPGTYLVICARTNHFVNDGMFGYVRVKKAEKDDD